MQDTAKKGEAILIITEAGSFCSSCGKPANHLQVKHAGSDLMFTGGCGDKFVGWGSFDGSNDGMELCSLPEVDLSGLEVILNVLMVNA